MNSGKLFLGILAGATAGALLGILFAPTSGLETRRNIARTSKKYANDVKNKFDETLDGISEKFNKVRDEATEFAHNARNKGEKLKNEHGVEIG